MTKLTEDQIKHMVSRFLGWSLPEDFRPDGGIIFSHTSGGHTNKPTGTNLFDGGQAQAMVLHMAAGMPEDRYFIGADCSGHTYLVPMSKRQQWYEWADIPEEDERAWEVPDFAKRIDGGRLTFAAPRIEP